MVGDPTGEAFKQLNWLGARLFALEAIVAKLADRGGVPEGNVQAWLKAAQDSTTDIFVIQNAGRHVADGIGKVDSVGPEGKAAKDMKDEEIEQELAEIRAGRDEAKQGDP